MEGEESEEEGRVEGGRMGRGKGRNGEVEWEGAWREWEGAWKEWEGGDGGRTGSRELGWDGGRDTQ